MAKRGVLGGYLDTTIYERSLLAERGGQDLIARPRGANAGLAKMPPDSARTPYQHRLWTTMQRVMTALRRCPRAQADCRLATPATFVSSFQARSLSLHTRPAGGPAPARPPPPGAA